MMKIILFLFLLPLSSLADDYRHIVSFGTGGFGWSGAVERMETEDKSPFSDVELFLSNISLNYGYRISQRFIIGGYYQTMNSEYKFRHGSTARVEREIDVLGLYTLYHFSDTISSAWYVGLSVARFSEEQEISHDIAVAESKTPFELDDKGMLYEVVLGKRFRLLKWNIDHLTYAPQVGVYFRSHSKDFDDQGVKDGFGVSLQPVKFDFLF
jgi:hypothetical protein